MRPCGRVALLRDHMESRHLGGALGQRASRPLRPTWGKRRLAAFTGGSQFIATAAAARWGEASRRAAPTGGARSRATAWKAAILAALQPPALHHRISQSPPGRDGVPPPSAPQPPAVARGACLPHNDVHSLQNSKMNFLQRTWQRRCGRAETRRASEPFGSSDAKTASSQLSRIQPLRFSAVSFDTLTTPCENGETTNIRPALIGSRYSTGTLRHIPRAKTITISGPPSGNSNFNTSRSNAL